MADPIKHVVVLMFENHSFDQMLGSAKQVYPQLEGIVREDGRYSVSMSLREAPQ